MKARETVYLAGGGSRRGATVSTTSHERWTGKASLAKGGPRQVAPVATLTRSSVEPG